MSSIDKLIEINNKNKAIIKVRAFEDINRLRIKKCENFYYLESTSGNDLLIESISDLYYVLVSSCDSYKTYITNLSIIKEGALVFQRFYIDKLSTYQIYKRIGTYAKCNNITKIVIERVKDLDFELSKMVLKGASIIFEKEYIFVVIFLKEKISILSEYNLIISAESFRFFYSGCTMWGIEPKNINFRNLCIDNGFGKDILWNEFC